MWTWKKNVCAIRFPVLAKDHKLGGLKQQNGFSAPPEVYQMSAGGFGPLSWPSLAFLAYGGHFSLPSLLTESSFLYHAHKTISHWN